ncbi:MAG: hypothetical protein CO028_02985 [Candidatus Levybacteria bacterium CG_4_9_14_0_2_um_filter_35_21]|nr:MAG: hypothetical protein CO028_02985 [Candidatus Levybacteria bacterium CG_4_9_14_0_2_um_filter_35_21]
MNIAIVGYGKMGKLYDSLLKAKFIIDLNPVLNKIYFSSVEEFIAYRQHVDLVIVATPIQDHFAVAKKLLENKYNVLCEKPICFSSNEAKVLERLAEKNNLILYQSTLERYNPLIKYFQKNINKEEIDEITSYRFGLVPNRSFSMNPRFDLGIHDVDLWFYLFKGLVSWKINVGYGKIRREIVVRMKDKSILKLDLLEKVLQHDSLILDFSKAPTNNPILEMILDLRYKQQKMNERWSDEVKILESSMGNSITLNKNYYSYQ